MKPVRLFQRILSSVALATLFLAIPSVARAQGQAEVDKPAFDDLPSPDINAGKSISFKPKDWLLVETKIRLPKGQRSDELFADQMTAKWYVAVKNPEGKGFFLLTKDVNHINVPLDEEIYISVYLSPSTVKRLTGSDRAGKNCVERVGVEILRAGVKVGEASTKDKPGWWNSPSLSRSDKYPLLDKNQTPFRGLWYDRYAEIQEKP